MKIYFSYQGGTNKIDMGVEFAMKMGCKFFILLVIHQKSGKLFSLSSFIMEILKPIQV